MGRQPTRVQLDVFLADSRAAAWFTRGLFHGVHPGDEAVFDGEPYRGGLLVDERYHVLRAYGTVHPYLRRHRQRDASLRCLLSKDLQSVVQGALRAARKRGLVKCVGNRLRDRAVSITVARLVGEFERYYYFVLFRDHPSSEATHRRPRAVEASVSQLKRQLSAMHRRLRAAQTGDERLSRLNQQLNGRHPEGDLTAMQRREEQYRDLTGRLLRLQDDERRRLSQDLHGSAAQRLAALTMSLDVLEPSLAQLDSQTRHTILRSRQLAEECFREIRAMAYVLHPPLLDEMGVVAALRWYVTRFTKRSGIRVEMRLDDVGRLSPAVETALFRAAQESLANVHQHASSDTASVELQNSAGWVVLEVRDAGRGLRDDRKQQDGTLSPEKLGVGIQGMRERIRRLGGSLDIDFTDRGTTVRARVPVHGGLAESHDLR